MRTFAYCRVSTTDQTTDNQAREIAASGFTVQPARIVVETISGSVATSERPMFSKLVERMEHGDVLVVTKLDRLGAQCHGCTVNGRSPGCHRHPCPLPCTRGCGPDQCGGEDDHAGAGRCGRVRA